MGEIKEVKEKKICGKKLATIRKAYFSGKISILLANIQAEMSIEEDELKEFIDFLQKLKDEEMQLMDKLNKEVDNGLFKNISDPKPPSVKDLNREMTDDEVSKHRQWLMNKEKAIRLIKTRFSQIRKDIFEKIDVPKQKWIDYALEVSALILYVDEDYIYKRQLWKKKMIEILDKYGISRKESEDRSEITDEYKDYKIASSLRDRVSELILLCKKHYSEMDQHGKY